MRNDIKEVLISEEQLKEKISEMGKQISQEYSGKDVVL